MYVCRAWVALKRRYASSTLTSSGTVLDASIVHQLIGRKQLSLKFVPRTKVYFFYDITFASAAVLAFRVECVHG